MNRCSLVVLTGLIGCGRGVGVGCKPEPQPIATAPAHSPEHTALPSANPSTSEAQPTATYTAFSIGVGTDAVGESPTTIYFSGVSLLNQRCTIWADAGPWDLNNLTPRTAAGEYVFADGRRVTWSCHTPDERIFTHIDVCGRTYALAEGEDFLISTRAGDIAVVQLNTTGGQYKNANFEQLVHDFPEAANLLAGRPLKRPQTKGTSEAAPSDGK